MLPEVRKLTITAAVNGVGINPLDVSQVPQGHSKQVDGVVDQSGLQVETPRELGEIKSSSHQQFLLDNPIIAYRKQTLPMGFLPVKTVKDKRSVIVDTPEEGEVGKVVFERFKVDSVSIKVGEDPVLISGDHS